MGSGYNGITGIGDFHDGLGRAHTNGLYFMGYPPVAETGVVARAACRPEGSSSASQPMNATPGALPALPAFDARASYRAAAGVHAPLGARSFFPCSRLGAALVRATAAAAAAAAVSDWRWSSVDACRPLALRVSQAAAS